MKRTSVADRSELADRPPLTPQVGSVFPSDQQNPQTESGTPEVPESVTPEVPESRSPEVPESRTSEVPESRTSGVPEFRSAGVTESGSGARWREYERKEARLRPDQLTALAALRRQVAAQRRDRSEIITDNTLIRVAVDLLLERRDLLQGDTEAALLESVLPPRRPARRKG